MATNIPILRIRDVLIATVGDDMHDELAMELQEELSARLSGGGARGVLIDVSAATVIDTFVGRMLISIGRAAKLVGAEAVVVGIRPAVAMTLVDLGISLEGLRTALDVDHALSLIAGLDETKVSGATQPDHSRRSRHR
ncbi:MAG: STAS domain-containing protein [Myxococcales bacterium]|nr:STAS domain-containing protein [Myxococcales bacterium]